MAKDLISDKTLQVLDGDTIREQITEKINTVKADFRHMPYEFERYNQRLADKLGKEWKVDVKQVKGRAPKKLEGMKDLAKEFRLRALLAITDEWYDRLWLIRSELALVSSIYEISGMTTIPEFVSHWTPRDFPEFKPVVLRMNGPRKPSKKNFKVSDIKYDVSQAFLDMMKPLEEWLNETVPVIDKLSGVRKKQSIDTKIKRFREVLLAREFMTVACQAVAPRQSSINGSNGQDNDD